MVQQETPISNTAMEAEVGQTYNRMTVNPGTAVKSATKLMKYGEDDNALSNDVKRDVNDVINGVPVVLCEKMTMFLFPVLAMVKTMVSLEMVFQR